MEDRQGVAWSSSTLVAACGWQEMGIVVLDTQRLETHVKKRM